MKKKPHAKKLLRQSFTCTPAEWREVQKRAAKAGLSASAYVRRLIFNTIAEGDK